MLRTPLNKLQSGDTLIMGPYQRHIAHWVDTVIQEITHSKFSHSCFYFHVDDVPQEIKDKFKCKCTHWIFEAKSKGNHFRPLTQTSYPDDYEWQAFRLKKEYRNRIPHLLEVISEFEGDKYNHWSSYFMGVIMLLPAGWDKFKAWVFSQPNPMAMKQAHFCSGTIVDAMLGIDIDIANDLGVHKDNVTSKDLQKVTFWNRVRYGK